VFYPPKPALCRAEVTYEHDHQVADYDDVFAADILVCFLGNVVRRSTSELEDGYNTTGVGVRQRAFFLLRPYVHKLLDMRGSPGVRQFLGRPDPSPDSSLDEEWLVRSALGHRRTHGQSPPESSP
jgi:hypothetical protein